MKLPPDQLRAKAYRKVPDEYGGLFRIIPLSDATFAEAKQAISALDSSEIADAFIWTERATFRAADILALMGGAVIKGHPPATHRNQWEEHFQIMASLHEIGEVIRTGILEPSSTRNPLFRSAVTTTLIGLNDLLAKAAERERIFAEDERGRTDLVEVISNARNAACHIGSKLSNAGTSTLRYGIINGPCGPAVIDDTIIACHYEDEVVIVFGKNPVYLRRDILAAYEKLQAFFANSQIS